MEKDSLFEKWCLKNQRATCKRIKVHKSVHCVTMSKIERTFIIVAGVVLQQMKLFINNFSEKYTLSCIPNKTREM